MKKTGKIVTRPLGKQSKEVSEKTKKTILDAALVIFAQKGFHDAKLRDIAAMAGTTHSLISHHFGSKDNLWKAVVDCGLKQRLDALKKIIESEQHLDPIVLFKMIIKSHILFTAQHADLAKILLHSHIRSNSQFEYIIKEQKKIHDLVEPLFMKVQSCGYFNDFNHDSFTIYMRAITETPIATSFHSNSLLGHDILSKEGITRHTQRVIDFLFHRKSEDLSGNKQDIPTPRHQG